MKIDTQVLKNKFKQGKVILFLISEVFINLMLFYPLTFSLSLAESSPGFSMFSLLVYLPLLSSVSGLVVLLSTRQGMIKVFSVLFFLSKLVLLIYIFLKLFQSWFGWLLLLFILLSIGTMVQFLRKALK